MRVLLDTNIIIYRENKKMTNYMCHQSEVRKSPYDCLL